MKNKKIIALLLAVFMVFTLAAGCSNGGNNETPPADTGNQTTQTPADTGKPDDTEKPLKIGVTLPTISSIHFANQKYGYETQGKEMGIEVTVVHADGYENVEKQINQIQDFVASGMDGIIVAACDADAVVNAEEEAIAAGIPVINVNNMSNTDKIYCQIRSDDTAMGTMAADLLAKKLDGKGKVIIVNAAAGSALVKRGEAFRAQIESKYPDIEIIAEQFIAPDAEKSTAAMEDFIQTYPEIDGLFSWSDTNAIPMAHVINTRGKDIKVVTIDCSNPDTRTAIRDGLIYGAIAQQPVTLGRLGVETLAKIIKGESYEKKIFAPIIEVTGETIDGLDLSGIIVPGQAK